MREEVFPPGQPTVERAGPLLPALETKTTLCLSQSKENCSRTALCCVCVWGGEREDEDTIRN